MVNKRGWLRIVEASIAILIVMTSLFVIHGQREPVQQTDYSLLAQEVLDEVAQTPALREAVAENDQETVEAFVEERIPALGTMAYELRMCELNTACGKSTYTPGSVYAAERIVSYTIPSQQGRGETMHPKKLRLFLWRNESA